MEKNIHDKIIESVSKIVHESGFKAVTTREVCKRAQISAPTLYHYFPNKQSMLEAATLSAYKKYIQDQNKKFPVRNPVRRIIYLWNGYFEFIEKEPEFFKIILFAHTDANIPKDGYLLFQDLVQEFSRLKETSKTTWYPKVAAQYFYTLAIGSALVYNSQNRSEKIRKSFRFIRNSALKHILSNGA